MRHLRRNFEIQSWMVSTDSSCCLEGQDIFYVTILWPAWWCNSIQKLCCKARALESWPRFQTKSRKNSEQKVNKKSTQKQHELLFYVKFHQDISDLSIASKDCVVKRVRLNHARVFKPNPVWTLSKKSTKTTTQKQRINNRKQYLLVCLV